MIMVNSGEMYRAVTLVVIQKEVDPSDPVAVVKLLEEIDLHCAVKEGLSVVLLEGTHPGAALRSDTVNAAVSQVAAVPEVRDLLVAAQRELLDLGDLVMEGRDIGSVVFPHTPFKIYIEASEEVRNQRRRAEGQVDEVSSRDRQDAERNISPLVVAEGAQVIDSSELSIEEVVEAALDVLRDRGWFERKGESATP